ncbi:glycosyl hydrolase [Microbispora sp. H11081]|uniref:glycosyl hydrolase n=1 Tax=Microbispora sp. H11081 TaxID=2729107 RepID=UPI0014756301|nr:glycosyl hydrolase [Microbispora sp. H11081]
MRRIVAAVVAVTAVLFGPQAPANADTPTAFGASVNQPSGQTFAQALAAADARYGKLPALRVFFTDGPAAWTDVRLNTPGRTTVVSFKYKPKDVLAGKYDAYLRSWFASAPRDRDIFWCFYHEPEDDIRDGHFTAEEYKSAWRRIDSLADEAGNARLFATTILMDYTLTKASGRQWEDYYPGSAYVDVMAWDVYGFDEASAETMAAHNASRPALEIARSQNKPYAVAELGVRDHANRPAMLRDIAKWMRNTADARFVTYYDSALWPQYDLVGDNASIQAWAGAVSGALFAGTPVMTTSAGPAAPTATTIEWTTRVDPAQQSGWVSCASWATATEGQFSEGPRQYVAGNPRTITCTRSGLQPRTAYQARLKWWDAQTGGTTLYKSNIVDLTTASG